MSGTVVPFRRPAAKPAMVPPGAIAITVSACAGEVVLSLDDIEVDLEPVQARELARDLLELADDAEGRRG